MVDALGCEADTDLDGVPDRLDDCPASAEGAEVDMTGCEPDGDADGVADAADACPADAMILDAGPATVERITKTLAGAQTLIWNGPLGAFEIPPFDAATNAAATAAAELTAEGTLISVAGGGDTVAALNVAGAADKFTYISTAGGAFLEWMEGKALPGVEALKK